MSPFEKKKHDGSASEDSQDAKMGLNFQVQDHLISAIKNKRQSIF